MSTHLLWFKYTVLLNITGIFCRIFTKIWTLAKIKMDPKGICYGGKKIALSLPCKINYYYKIFWSSLCTVEQGPFFWLFALSSKRSCNTWCMSEIFFWSNSMLATTKPLIVYYSKMIISEKSKVHLKSVIQWMLRLLKCQSNFFDPFFLLLFSYENIRNRKR